MFFVVVLVKCLMSAQMALKQTFFMNFALPLCRGGFGCILEIAAITLRCSFILQAFRNSPCRSSSHDVRFCFGPPFKTLCSCCCSVSWWGWWVVGCQMSWPKIRQTNFWNIIFLKLHHSSTHHCRSYEFFQIFEILPVGNPGSMTKLAE